jgi:aminopeptidase N
MKLKAVGVAVLVLGLVSPVVSPFALAGGGFTPGSVGIGDPYVPEEGNGGYQVRRYDLDLRFNPTTDRLRGVATIRATATQDLSAFNLDLYGLNVSSVDVNGVPASSIGRAPRELSVGLTSGIPDGERFVAVVEYQGKPKKLDDPDLGLSGWFNTKDGAIVVGEPEAGMFWFPVNEHPSDKAKMSVTITVPKGLKAV